MSKASRNASGGTSAFLLAEEAVQLLIHAGLGAASVYAIGSLPFVVGLIAYVGTMTHSGHAYQYLGTGALGLALLFLWMKVFQARFARHLLAALRHESIPSWSLGQFLATLCRQGFIHASVVIVYPVAFITLLPMGFAVAMYQNASVLDDGSAMSLRALAGRALSEARRWPKQNHILLWLCSPLMVCMGAGIALGTFPVLDSLEDQFLVSLGLVYASILLIAALPVAPFAVVTLVNVGSGLFFSIELFHVFTGADTLYSRNPGVLLENDLFIACACGATYLLLDPVLKAAYTIRCHEGESQASGIDLKVSLRRIRQGVSCVLLLATLTLALPGQADTTPQDIDIAPLEQAIDQELTERRYTWRMPREPRPDVELPWLLQLLSDFGDSVRGWIKVGFNAIGDFLETIWDWFFGEPDVEGSTGGHDFRGFNQTIRILIGLLAGALVALTVYLVWRNFRDRQPELIAPVVPAPAQTPDLRDESTTAADLPEEEWYQLARDFAAKGDYRLASRALFFSILATLAHREVIRIAPFKSNMDYGHELTRRAMALGTVPQLFSRSALLYEAVWYGEHKATAQTLQALQACQEELRHGLS